MSRILPAAALMLAAASSAVAASAADLEAEVEELKKQVAELSRQLPDQQPPKIGVVNVLRVFNELEEKIDMNAELRQEDAKREARLRELVDRVKDLQEKSKLVRPESDEGKKTAQLLEEARRELRSYSEASEDHMYNKLFDFTLRIYNKIRKEIDAYAQEQAYDLVLRTRDAELAGFPQSMSPRIRYSELNRQVEERSVLFARPAYDFTEEIIRRMNAKYRRQETEKRKHRPGPEPQDEP
ncbi:MAG: OmpH family outer membrane protein [Candidatus Brocadiia bacterium]